MNEQLLNRLRARLARAIAPPALHDKIHISGLIRARAVPFETREEWIKWWLPERNEAGQMMRAARISDREKERYTVAESSNILVAAGITQVLTFIGSSSGNSTAFAQYFALGNIGLTQVESSDTSVAGEYFRAIPSLASVSGVQQDLSVFAGTAQANGTITNCGLFGVNATATLASGTLMTHSLFSYGKINTLAVTFDYLISYT